VFATASSGTAAEAMRIDSAGNLGIGTASPDARFHVSGGDILLDNDERLFIKNAAGTQTNLIYADSGDDLYIGSSDLDNVYMQDSTGTAVSITSGNVGIGTTTPETELEVIGTMSGATVYSASGLIVESGRVGIGTSSPTAKLEIVGTMSGKSLIINTNQTNETGAIFLDQDGNGTGMLIDSEATNAPGLAIDMAGTTAQVPNAPHLLFGYNGAFDTNLYRSDANQLRTDDSFGIGRSPATYALEVQGDAGKTSGGTSWQSISDQRFKEVQSSIENAVETINQLNPVEYYWNDLKREKYGDIDRGLKFGFLAQELQHVLPELVNQDKEGYFWYNPSGFEAILSAAIQELDAKVSSLEERMISAEGAGSVLTVSGGIIDITAGYHLVAMKKDVKKDVLERIRGGVLGQVLVLQPRNKQKIELRMSRHLLLEKDFKMHNEGDIIVLLKIDDHRWVELTRVKSNDSRLVDIFSGWEEEVFGKMDDEEDYE
jgi:hypothetical protein